MRPDQPVTFRVDAYPTDTFHGKVQQVRLQPTTVQNVVTYSTVISVPNDELKLKPGMTANVTIEISRKNNVLRIPNAALRFRPSADVFAALKQEVPPELQRGFGRGGPGQSGQGGRGGFSGASGQPGAQPPSMIQGTPSTQPSTPRGQNAPPEGGPPSQNNQPRTDRGQRTQGQPTAQAQGGSDRGGERPSGERTDRGEGRRGDAGRGGFANMTPEEREARRKQFEERLKNMSPEERAQFEARRRERGSGRGGGSGDGRAGDGSSTGSASGGRGGGAGTRTADNQWREGAPAQQNTRRESQQAPQSGSRIATTKETTIDALFAPIVAVEGRGRIWLYINKQLKSVPVRTGITDGTWTEMLETADTAQLQVGAEVVTNVTTGLETQQRPGQQGPGNNPLMPQRGGPGRGGPGGGGPGRGR
jgi:hypothetical protein